METTGAQITRLEHEIEYLQEELETIHNYVPANVAKVMEKYIMIEMDNKIQKVQKLIAA